MNIPTNNYHYTGRPYRALGNAGSLARTNDALVNANTAKQPMIIRLHNMKMFAWALDTVSLILLISVSGCSTSLDDASPENPNGTNQGGFSTAGLIIGIAGTNEALYAVSPNAGIWKNSMTAGKFGRWSQLPNSPRYSNCIAVDPTNDLHVVVGERDGDAISNAANHCGVWESFDGGNTFANYFDPAPSLIKPRDRPIYQIVESVLFTQQQTILAATYYGIARKPASASGFVFDHSPTSSLITAMSVFDQYIVARDEANIYISNTDGVDWTTIEIPSAVDGYTFTNNSRGDLYSIAGSRGGNSGSKFFVYLSFKPAENVGNKNSILIYDVAQNVWHAQLLSTGDGTGLGGRRFLRSFDITLAHPRVVKQYHLIYCGAQDVSEATSIDDNGFPAWHRFLADVAAAFSAPTPNDNVHPDLWDIFLDQHNTHAFVACDGGVFIGNPQSTPPTWASLNSGLHTLHIHSIVTSFDNNINMAAFATSDNDAWAFINRTGWFPIGDMGDANWVTNDQLVGTQLISARHFENARLTSFPSIPIPTTSTTINNDVSIQVEQIKTIQTMPGEAQQNSLDVLMLARLPLEYQQGTTLTPVPGSLGQPATNGNLVILRHKHFESNPDINISKGAGWELFSYIFPPGTSAFWVAGGHNSPRCFVYAVENGVPGIYKRQVTFPSTNGPPLSSWVRLNINDVDDPPAEYGPLFVNPYNAQTMYVATPSGIYVSNNGGSSFQKDNTLTNLVTGSGKFPMNGTFSGGNGTFLPGSMASHANKMCPLSCMAFSADTSSTTNIVASSPFTGVFFKDHNSDWKDMTKYLPTPFTPISSVSITKYDIYVGTEGRGLLRINYY